MRNRTVANVTAGIVICLGTQAYASSEAEEYAAELAIKQMLNMEVTYTCQNYLGGLGWYRAAKTDMIFTSMSMGNKRGEAILTVDRYHQKLVAEAPHENLGLKQRDVLDDSDFLQICLGLMGETADRIQVLKAHLGLLD